MKSAENQQYSSAQNVRQYSLAHLENIDFEISDDFATVVLCLKNIITLRKDVDDFWTTEHEEILWRFVVDPDSLLLVCYFLDNVLHVERSLPTNPSQELFYFIKTSHNKLTTENYRSTSLYGMIKAPFFDSFYDLFHAVYGPMFMKSEEWSNSIQTDFIFHLCKFLSDLFNLRNGLNEKTVFYVPEIILEKTVEEIIEEKELLNQTEKTVGKWLRTLTNLLAKRGTPFKLTSEPLKAIKFWNDRLSDLDNVVVQLNRNEVKKCTQVLKIAKLASYSKFVERFQEIQEENEVASRNVKFLSILKNPCNHLKTCSLPDIPNKFSELLDRLRIIWNNSLYFQNENEINDLLSQVVNFTINVMSAHVPAAEIFSFAQNNEVKKIEAVIDCCKGCAEKFDISENVHNKMASQNWSVTSISLPINLFIHRCEDLIEICHLKEEFFCSANIEQYQPQHICFEVIEQLKVIEKHFSKVLHNLNEKMDSALDISDTSWYESFKKFKKDVQDLYTTISKLMVYSFESVNRIEDGIEALKLFQKYFKKEAIKSDLQRCIGILYELYFQEIKFVRKKLISTSTDSEDLSLPTYSGRAFRVSLLPHRMKQLHKILDESRKTWPGGDDLSMTNYHQRVLVSSQDLIHTFYLQWIRTLPKDPYTWLKEPIIIPEDDKAPLKLNVNSSILNLLQELNHWDMLEVEIPQNLIQLHEKRNVFLERIMTLTELAKNYNRLLDSLSSEERYLFSESIDLLNKNVMSALKHLNWSTSDATLSGSVLTIKEKTKSFKEMMLQYRGIETKLVKLCKEIGNIVPFDVAFDVLIDFSDFIAKQVSWRQKCMQNISELSKMIYNTGDQICELVKSKSGSFSDLEWLQNKLTNLLCPTLVDCYRKVLKRAASMFGVNRLNKMKVIFKVTFMLENNQLCFVPNFQSFTARIDELMNDIKLSLSNFLNLEGEFIGRFDRKQQFLDVVADNSVIVNLERELEYGVNLLCEAGESYELDWKPLCCLWGTNKTDLIQSYQERGWIISDFERDLTKFQDIGRMVNLVPRYKVLEFCLIDCQPLKDVATDLSENWKNEFGQIFHQMTLPENTEQVASECLFHSIDVAETTEKLLEN